MWDIYLPVFPRESLAGSVTTTVWIGVAVAAFYNLRFGWSLSGLVIPGYLVPLILLKPLSAAVIVVEGAVTYVVVLWLFEYLSALGLWNKVFGRDRFFALLLVSVIVRLTFDVFLLPMIGAYINETYAVQFDYRNDFHSFGLIIVALIANQFWKPGLIRGLFPLFMIVGTTYAIVRFGLMETTNFSIGGLEYLYEDIASSMLASPKAYIILLTTAFLASHMNLRYGWEYSGILIPSLIALLWYQPMKIGASLAEAFIILIFAGLALKLPVLKRTTIEGARKVLLFFNISYLYKFILAYAILYFTPEKKITDYYAFGYLLPSLIAIKMHDKNITAMITRATLQTSLAAVFIAGAIGFTLTLLPQFHSDAPTSAADTQKAAPAVSDKRLIQVIREEKLNLYRNRFQDRIIIPLPMELERFSLAIQYLVNYTDTKAPGLLTKACRILDQLGYQVKNIEGRYLYISEKPENRKNRGAYLIDTDPNPENRLLVEIPYPLAENRVMEAGTLLFKMMNGRALAIAGNRIRASSPDVLTVYRSFFHIFHKRLAFRDVLQVRGYTSRNVRALKGLRKDATAVETPDAASALYVKSSLPPGLHLGILEQLIDDFDIVWKPPPLHNIQRDATGKGFAELYLNRSDMRKILYKQVFAEGEVREIIRGQRIDGYLQDWILGGKEMVAPEGSEQYGVPELEELLFFDEEVLTPLIRAASESYPDGAWTEEGVLELGAVSAAAALVGYEVIRYRYKISGTDYLILAETRDLSKRKYWGTFVFRLGPSEGYLIQAPRPLFELNVFEYAVSLFERLNAHALLIGGAHKNANLDGTADLIRLQNLQNAFNLVNQVVLRESGDRPMLAIQTRALGVNPDQPDPAADVLISFGRGEREIDSLSPLGTRLVNTLNQDGLNYRFVDGTRATAGYEVGGLPQSLYLDQTKNKEFVILWLSAVTRLQYKQQTENFQRETQFKTLNIPTVQGYLYPYLLEKSNRDGREKPPQALIDQIKQYIMRQDVILLRSITEEWKRYRFKQFIDMDTRQSFLMIFSKSNKLIMAANLIPRDLDSEYRLDDPGKADDVVREFLNTRSARLITGKVPEP